MLKSTFISCFVDKFWFQSSILSAYMFVTFSLKQKENFTGIYNYRLTYYYIVFSGEIPHILLYFYKLLIEDASQINRRKTLVGYIIIC